VDAAYTVAELAVLLDLAADRLFDLQRDFLALQEQLVRAYAQLASLPTPMELQPWQQQPGEDLWGDQPST
jgi:hypothetical protein